MSRRPGPALLWPSLVIAVGVTVSAWPLDGLFTGAPWRGPLLLLTLAVAVTGAATRLVDRRLAPVTQALVLLAGLTSTFSSGTAVAGVLPTPETLRVAAALVNDAVMTIATSPPPAPATEGVTFVFAAGFALVAYLADVIGVTWERPLLAAVPLLVPFLAAVANVGDVLPWYHLVGVVAVIALLAHDGHRRSVGRWAAPAARPDQIAAGVGGQPLVATVLGVGAVALALVVAGMLPHLPTRFVADGLGRTGGAAQVGFSPSPDLLTDLRDDDDTPVLRYTTDDPMPPPLKVSVAHRYLGEGRWEADPAGTPPSDSPVFPPPPGLAPDLETQTREITVTSTRLDPPYLAAPALVVGGSVTGAEWAMDPRDQVLVVDPRPSSYTMTYLHVPRDTGGAAIVDTGALLDVGAITPDDVDTSGSTPLLRDTLGEVTAEATTPAQRADAIQRWLREDPSFTYSLELPAEPSSAHPLDAFLLDRQGYCVQFATTMVLMAREEGIPARLATGFLSGAPDGDARVVRANDAHAWPELYLDELGWVRYEPTPASRAGLAPTYGAVPEQTGDAEDVLTPEQEATAEAPDPGAAPQQPDGDPDAIDLDAGRGETGEAASDGPAWVPVMLGVLALLVLLLLASPLLSGLRHRRRLAAASSPALAVEEHWRRLVTRLADLGITAPVAATVRARGEIYRRELTNRATASSPGAATGSGATEASASAPASAQGGAPAALDRVVATVERARYAGPGAEVDDDDVRRLRDDADEVVRAARQGVDPAVRRRARLAPSDGLPLPRRDTLQRV